MYSTPLSLLHLPPTVLPEVTQQLTQPGNSTMRFFQDGKSLEDSKQLLSEVDLQHINEADVDIGFVCKKCQMVFPSEVLCLNHQKSSCFVTKVAGDIKAMLKLVQIQMECGACRERFTTVMDLRFHCSLDRHVKRIQRENIPIPPVSSNTSVLGPSTSIHSVLEASSANVPLAIREPSSSLPLSSLRGCSTLRGLHPTLGGSLTSSSPTQGGTASIQSPAIESPFLLPSTNQPQINCSESNPINCTSPIFQQDRLDAPAVLDSMMVEQGQEPHSVNIPVSDRMLSKAGICNSGDASFSPETKRL